ncbi:MAG: enoyl-CoA hydratase/isomerase family protein [Ignavibacteriaceae bacterium]|nr:enoyl-CoA hydratase/isomerase family protein [Ignavibacteriaceae bacterium]
MTYQTLLIETANKVATVTINRPDKLNALNHQVLTDLKSAVHELNNSSDVKVIVITGSGEKSFVAGADISELNKCSALSGLDFAEYGQGVFEDIENSQKPVIAAVNGFALGGGCELALACHIRYAAENAKFGQPEVNLGIIPGYGGTQRLARLINQARAAEMILTGDMITADEAYRTGLVNRVFPKEEFMAKVMETALKIASKPMNAVKYSLSAIRQTAHMNLSAGLKYEASLFGICCDTKDFREGTNAFLEKRPASFTDQ